MNLAEYQPLQMRIHRLDHVIVFRSRSRRGTGLSRSPCGNRSSAKFLSFLMATCKVRSDSQVKLMPDSILSFLRGFSIKLPTGNFKGKG